MRVVLGSASPARLATLRSAGVDPEVIVSGVDESGITAASPRDLAGRLATLKGDAVAERVTGPCVVLGCDSVLEFEGVAHGRPVDVDDARSRWQRMRGRSGVLHTGHRVIVLDDEDRRVTVVGSTTVHFADLTDDEINAYLATGEPLQVAGAFTVDGIGGPFVDRLEGDPHNVAGISLPLLRRTLADLGMAWPSLWSMPDQPQAQS